MKLHASNRILVLPEYAFALCELGSWPFQSTMDINILPEACLAYDTLAESENQLEEPASAVPETNSGTSKRNASTKAKAKADPKAREPPVVPLRQVPVVKTRPCTLMQPWHPRWLRTYSFHLRDQIPTIQLRSNRVLQAISDSQPLAGMTRPESGTNPPGTFCS